MYLHNAKAFLRNKEILQFEFISQEEIYSLWVHGCYFYLYIISPSETQMKEFKINIKSKFVPMTHEITCNLF